MVVEWTHYVVRGREGVVWSGPTMWCAGPTVGRQAPVPIVNSHLVIQYYLGWEHGVWFGIKDVDCGLLKNACTGMQKIVCLLRYASVTLLVEPGIPLCFGRVGLYLG